MNLGVNPCDDLFEFTCGKFKDNLVMVDHQDKKSEFSMMEQRLKWKLKDLFEEEWKKLQDCT